MGGVATGWYYVSGMTFSVPGARVALSLQCPVNCNMSAFIHIYLSSEYLNGTFTALSKHLNTGNGD